MFINFYDFRNVPRDPDPKIWVLCFHSRSKQKGLIPWVMPNLHVALDHSYGIRPVTIGQQAATLNFSNNLSILLSYVLPDELIH